MAECHQDALLVGHLHAADTSRLDAQRRAAERCLHRLGCCRRRLEGRRAGDLRVGRWGVNELSGLASSSQGCPASRRPQEAGATAAATSGPLLAGLPWPATCHTKLVATAAGREVGRGGGQGGAARLPASQPRPLAAQCRAYRLACLLLLSDSLESCAVRESDMAAASASPSAWRATAKTTRVVPPCSRPWRPDGGALGGGPSTPCWPSCTSGGAAWGLPVRITRRCRRR